MYTVRICCVCERKPWAPGNALEHTRVAEAGCVVDAGPIDGCRSMNALGAGIARASIYRAQAGSE